MRELGAQRRLGHRSDRHMSAGAEVTGSAPAVHRVHHLLLETRDLDASERFYVDVLGFAVRKREDFRDGRRLTVTKQGLGLTEGGSGSAGVLQHLCFSARSVDAIAARAEAEGC